MDRKHIFATFLEYIYISVVYKNDSRFLPPYTEHGMNSRSKDPIYFEVGGTRCRNSSNNPVICLPNDEIDKLLQWSNYRIHFFDNYFDIMNYEEPVVKYIMEIRGAASESTTASNYINFVNVDLLTHDGLIFDNTKQISSYKFLDRVEIVSKILKEEEREMIFFFRLEGQNHPTLYDRTYSTLQEILANIGGLVKILFLMAQIVNNIYNSYVIRRDLFWKVFRHLVDFKKDKTVSLKKRFPEKTKQSNY